jgi:predicted  nucleic acid-binding Zn-ribbon protein
MPIKLTNDIVDQRLLDSCRNIKRIGNYENNHEKIDWQCLKCNYVWKAKACHILNDRGCPKCSDRIKLSDDVVDLKLLELNKYIERIGSYKNNRTPIAWKCLKCDYIWEAVSYLILNTSVGCPKCAGVAKLSNKDVDKKLTNKPVKRIGDYINLDSKIEWECSSCNLIWKATPHSVFNSKTGCPKCNTPGSNEKLMHLLLIKSHIDYELQFCLKNIDKNAPAYRFDAFIPSTKIAIEYNGKQHYEATRLFNEDPDQQFLKQQNRDNYVRDFCDRFDIKLIEIDGRIFYGEKLKNYLLNELIPTLM